MFYFTKTPWLVEKMFPEYVWHVPETDKKIFLSFDDGPHPVATNFVLDTLARFNAKATFFCVGKQVQQYPDIYSRILAEGHITGNHTQDHLNGSKVSDRAYFKSVGDARKFIDSKFFRPPYGRITSFQARQLIDKLDYKIIMWSVLSGDFDLKISQEQCLNNVLQKTGKGSIVVFHDSEKAFKRMSFALPKVLEHFSKDGFSFEAISL